MSICFQSNPSFPIVGCRWLSRFIRNFLKRSILVLIQFEVCVLFVSVIDHVCFSDHVADSDVRFHRTKMMNSKKTKIRCQTNLIHPDHPLHRCLTSRRRIRSLFVVPCLGCQSIENRRMEMNQTNVIQNVLKKSIHLNVFHQYLTDCPQLQHFADALVVAACVVPLRLDAATACQRLPSQSWLDADVQQYCQSLLGPAPKSVHTLLLIPASFQTH